MIPSKRVLKRIAIGLGLLLGLLLIANVVYSWWVNRQVESRLAAIREAGDPASMSDLLAQLPPPDENSAEALKKISAELDHFEKQYGAFSDTPLGIAFYQNQERGVVPDPAQIAEIEKIVDSFSELSKKLKQAITLPEFAMVAPLDALIDSTRQLRSVSHFIEWEMLVAVANHQQDEAVRKGILLLQLTRRMQRNSVIVHYLVAIAMRGVAIDGINQALRAGPVSTETHAVLEQELALQDDPQPLVHVLKNERAFSIDAFEDTFVQVGPPGLRWLNKGWQRNILDYYTELITRAHRPISEIGSLDAGLNPHNDPFINLLTPATKAMFDASNRDWALIRALRILNALNEFAEKNGRPAESLQDLSLPEKSMLDPFDGKLLRLKKAGDEWVIYSISTNRKDDGGDFKDLKDYGLAPQGYAR